MERTHRATMCSTSGLEMTYQHDIGQFVRTKVLWDAVREMTLFSVNHIEQIVDILVLVPRQDILHQLSKITPRQVVRVIFQQRLEQRLDCCMLRGFGSKCVCKKNVSLRHGPAVKCQVQKF